MGGSRRGRRRRLLDRAREVDVDIHIVGIARGRLFCRRGHFERRGERTGPSRSVEESLRHRLVERHLFFPVRANRRRRLLRELCYHGRCRGWRSRLLFALWRLVGGRL